jgi:hypothetical protein
MARPPAGLASLSRDEIASIAVIAITVAVFAWFRTDMTGVQRWTGTLVALLVSGAVATATTAVLKTLNPGWYRS